MNIICVDDEKIILDNLVAKCKEIDFVNNIHKFRSGLKALDFFTETDEIIDAAILDIDMADINGLDLAVRIKQHNPYTEVIFATGFANFAVNAFKIRASGYLLKPISKEDLVEELNVVLKKHTADSSSENKYLNGIYARTFGNFDLLVNGKPVDFSWKKGKEVLAYLIDRKGATVSRKELAGIIWEDEEYSRSNQTYLSKIINELSKNLAAAGAEHIFIKGKDSYSVDTTALSCDSWNYLNGDSTVKFHGEYMLQYSWAELSIGKFENL